MSDPIREYSNAMDELNKAYEDVRAVQGIIGKVDSGLQKPYEFMVSNVSVGFPPEVAMGRLPTLNAKEWPTAERIATVLANLHQKRHQVDNLWHSLSDADKKIVSPPPELVIP